MPPVSFSSTVAVSLTLWASLGEWVNKNHDKIVGEVVALALKYRYNHSALVHFICTGIVAN